MLFTDAHHFILHRTSHLAPRTCLPDVTYSVASFRQHNYRATMTDLLMSFRDVAEVHELDEGSQGPALSRSIEMPAEKKPRGTPKSGTLEHDKSRPDTVRICGRSAIACGYCKGSRNWVFEVDNPNPAEVASEALVRPEASFAGGAEERPNHFPHAKREVPDPDNASRSYGLVFSTLSPASYQKLLNLGWRRSGDHLYKPDNWRSCCPALSIRLDTRKHEIGKGQRRVIHRLGTYLKGKKSDGARDSKKERRRDSTTFSAMQIIRSSSILDDLLKVTVNAIDSFPFADRSWAPPATEVVKLCQWKVTTTVPKQVSRKLASRKGVDPRLSALLAVSTSVCPAMSGRSKGKIDPIALSIHISNAVNRTIEKMATDDKMEIVSVEPHKGGRINAYLRIDTSSAASSADDGVSMEESPSDPKKYAQDVVGGDMQLMSNRIRNPCNANDSVGVGGGTGPHTLTVRSIPAQVSASQPEVHRLFARYQTAVHGEPDSFKPSPRWRGENAKCKSSNEIAASDELELPPRNSNPGDSLSESLDDPDLDDYIEEDSTWDRHVYDIDEVYGHLSSRRRERIRRGYINFYSFLCETPLPLVAPTTTADARFRVDGEGYDTHIPHGTYHQQYRINGVLIAVGVVDVLPNCLSSVYAFYDPELSRHLELGKYTALREIEWVKRASIHRPGLAYYYLGFYIPSCAKMSYKAEYKPSELLCPATARWVDFEAAKERLDTHSPVRHCCALSLTDPSDGREGHGNPHHPRERSGRQAPIEAVSLNIGSGGGGGAPLPPEAGGGQQQPSVTVGMLNRQGRAIVTPLVEEFIDEVGPEVSRRCIIQLC